MGNFDQNPSEKTDASKIWTGLDAIVITAKIMMLDAYTYLLKLGFRLVT